VALALVGIYAFTQDPTGVVDAMASASASASAPSASASELAMAAQHVHTGDGLVLGAAFFYSIYDIQTFYWDKRVPRTELVTIKVGFQAALSCILCACATHDQVVDYLVNSNPDLSVLVPTVLWSGLIVNALAMFLQVSGMQAVGPVRAQIIRIKIPYDTNASEKHLDLIQPPAVVAYVGHGQGSFRFVSARSTDLPKLLLYPSNRAEQVPNVGPPPGRVSSRREASTHQSIRLFWSRDRDRL
jgi:drug/metabolite transporter (DMT)-like permease